MAQQKTAFHSWKSIAGAALVVFGMFMLQQDVAGTVTHLRHVFGANGSGTLGIVPAILLSASHALQAGHQRFMEGFVEHLSVLFWPLLLVRLGTVMSRDSFVDNSIELPKTDFDLVDFPARRSTLK